MMLYKFVMIRIVIAIVLLACCQNTQVQ